MTLLSNRNILEGVENGIQEGGVNFYLEKKTVAFSIPCNPTDNFEFFKNVVKCSNILHIPVLVCNVIGIFQVGREKIKVIEIFFNHTAYQECDPIDL